MVPASSDNWGWTVHTVIRTRNGGMVLMSTSLSHVKHHKIYIEAGASKGCCIGSARMHRMWKVQFAVHNRWHFLFSYFLNVLWLQILGVASAIRTQLIEASLVMIACNMAKFFVLVKLSNQHGCTIVYVCVYLNLDHFCPLQLMWSTHTFVSLAT